VDLGYETIQLQVNQLENLPADIANLESTLQLLHETQLPSSTDASLNLPLPATLSLLGTREAELAELNAQLRALESALPRKTRELERLENELKPLEFQRRGVTAAAKEARRRKEEALNGKGDDLEARGRWWRGVEAGLKAMLEVES
jgi:chromosome segregation ATPase